jgi:hypothetical protein
VEGVLSSGNLRVFYKLEFLTLPDNAIESNTYTVFYTTISQFLTNACCITVKKIIVNKKLQTRLKIRLGITSEPYTSLLHSFDIMSELFL